MFFRRGQGANHSTAPERGLRTGAAAKKRVRISSKALPRKKKAQQNN